MEGLVGIIWVSCGSVEGIQQTLGDWLWHMVHRDNQSFVHNEDTDRDAGVWGLSLHSKRARVLGERTWALVRACPGDQGAGGRRGMGITPIV